MRITLPRNLFSDRKLLFRIGLIPTAIVLAAYFCSWFFPPSRVLIAPRLDSILDGIGAYIALNLAILLWLGRQHYDDTNYRAQTWASAALFSIGIIKMWCATTEDMNVSLWDHALVRFMGGLLFALTWIVPTRNRTGFLFRFLPALAAVVSTLVGLALFMSPIPAAFSGLIITRLCSGVTVVAGLLFLTSAWLWHKRSASVEITYVGSLHSLFLFYASSSLLFPFTYLWGPRWWLVQVLELTPFLIALVHKIRAYTELQNQLIETRNSLKRSNDSLEHFAYMASHDLQEPLRTIRAYLSLLEKKNATALDESSREYIGFCTSAAARMRIYISELLNYSRINLGEKVTESVDPGNILKEVTANLGQAISASSAEIECSPLPKLKVARSHLMLLMQNLLSNAIKYRSKTATPKICISSEQKNGEFIVSVSDNGIGFDPAQAERIFEMFHRAHGKHEYEGAGIGLAACKKIVDGWGGRIWATSVPDEGSVFRVAIPLKRVQEASS